MQPMDLNLIATLAVLLRTRSVSGAARQLGTSAPTVSRALARLRELTGDELLVRTGSGMRRTARGDALVSRVEDWLAAAPNLLAAEQFDPAHLVRTFRVATTDFGMMSVLAPALPLIAAQAPLLCVEAVPLPGDPLAQLADGTFDLAITGQELDLARAHETFLFAECLVCLMRPGHPLAGSVEPLEIEDYLGPPHISVLVGDAPLDLIDQRLTERGLRRQVVARLPYFHAAPALIGSSDMLVTLPGRAAAPFARMHGLATRPAPIELGGFTYHVLRHERLRRDPAALWLVDQLVAATR